MASVDDRIVRMEFDNASFEKKAGTTLTTLDKLNKGLKFDNMGKGLSDIGAAAGKLNLGHIGDALESIKSKFQALGVIGITVLANLTNKIVNTGLAMAKHLTLDNIIAGFKEYETNMNSIQTILANTKADGTNLQQVNAALDQLNEYSDKTIYNFGQMTRNIGTFTAAGVDLDTSVRSIKGISNLAAISGSSAEQASTAMYQLSQAVSTGTLRLQDWNSVVNAGMGGEVFQKALFESGKALGTIKNVPIGETFEEWTKKGNTFRGSLEDQWLTSEVLTTTLAGFTGEMTDAELAAKGFSKEQIKTIQEMGKTGVEAATKVRTLSQLIDTTKESIGSGWSQSFRLVLGNFEEATQLFTGLSDRIGKFVGKNADARNKVLSDWKALGGGMVLFAALNDAFGNLMALLKPIKDAFRDIFPPMTGKRLADLTLGFYNLVQALKPSEALVAALRSIFRGFFGILSIGWTIIKEGIKFVGELFQAFAGAGSGKILGFIGKIGDFFTGLQDALVKGGGIKAFFDGLLESLQKPIEKLKELKDKIGEFFSSLDPKMPDAVGESMGRVGDRLGTVKDALEKVQGAWGPFKRAMQKVGRILDDVWTSIKDWFSDLGKKIADVMGEGEFDQALDAINTGLLGGIVLLLTRFLKNGFKFDIGGGFLDKIGETFESLTGYLTSMQQNVKADTLQKIAIAIGILTASVLVLSLIDSAALTKSLAAMAVGFGQLIGAFAVLSKINSGPKGALNMGLLAAGLIVLSGAILILSLACAALAKLDWAGLAVGLTGVSSMLLIMAGFAKLMEGSEAKLIGVGLGMIGVALGISILAGAVKIFASMSWGELAKGMAAVAGGLLIIAGAMHLMPKGLALQAVGLLLIAVSLNVLAGAVAIFGNMDLVTIGKGFVTIGAGLLIIGLAMKAMPAAKMLVIGVGLLGVSVALVILAKAMQMMGALSWGEIAKGMVTLLGSLLILSAAMEAMSGTIAGSIALGIAAVSLLLLAQVIKQFASIKFGDLLKGLLAMAIVLAALALAALALQPAIPAMVALGIALIAIGAGFALFGIGAALVAKAFEALAKAGKAGSEALVAALKAIGKALPSLFVGFAEGLVEFVATLAKLAPQIVDALVVILGKLLDGLKKLIPKLLEVIGELISGLINLIKTKYPELVIAGIELILALLKGIRDNIGEVVTVVGEIITEFLDALGTQLVSIVDSVVTLFVNLLTAVAEGVGRVSGTLMFGIGIAFLKGFLDGVTSAAPGVTSWFMELAGKVVGWVGNVLKTLWNKGVDLITGLLGGIGSKAKELVTWLANLGANILKWVGNFAKTLWNKGIDLIVGLLGGIGAKAKEVISWFQGLGSKVVGWVGNLLNTLKDKGSQLISGLFSGISDRWVGVVNWFNGLKDRFVGFIKNPLTILKQIGKDIIQGLWNGMKEVWDKVGDWLGGLGDKVTGFFKNPLGIFSPSRVMAEIGEFTIMGFQIGMEKEWDKTAKWMSNMDVVDQIGVGDPNKLVDTFQSIIAAAYEAVDTLPETNIVITPVLDLTKVAEDASKINDYINTSATLSPSYSTEAARTIASSTNAQQEGSPIDQPAGSGEVKFTQIINAPAQLSTGDIYRNTRNQITMAKEELSIP